MENKIHSKLRDFPLKKPIFILGIGMRSGTNFLFDQLCLHPDCESGGVIWEDFLTEHSNLLLKYANSVSRYWGYDLTPEETRSEKELVLQCAGNGLIQFLNLQAFATDLTKLHAKERNFTHLLEFTSEKRLVTKTPSVANLDNFFKIFPSAHLLIIIRDGRAVVESSTKSLDLSDRNVIAKILNKFKYEMEMRKWARAAKTILAFDEASRDTDLQYRIVKYETLCTDPEKELRKILTFLDLDEEKFDFSAAANLPVRGSSVLRGEKEDVHWEPVKKTAEFNPLQRWQHWSRALHERFNWIAGKLSVQLGYEKKEFSSNRLFWTIRNILLDILWFGGGVFVFNMSQSQRFDKLKRGLKSRFKSGKKA